MSLLRNFKETLKPCKNLSFSSSFSQSSLSQEEPEPTLINQRKPPKSSLSQQLQRLEQDYFPSTQQSYSQNPKFTQTQVQNNGDNQGEEVEEEGGVKEFGRPELSRALFEDTGPYEPLVLSSDGEFPVVQVIVL